MTNWQADKTEEALKQHEELPESTPRNFSDIELRNVFESGIDTDLLPELIRISNDLLPATEDGFIIRLHNDIDAIFDGKKQGFRKSNIKYHDLRHTRSVVLATMRLFHGLKCDGHHLPDDVIKLGILCAYFHDTGMLVTIHDSESNGSAYLKYHEKRSINFAREYIYELGLPGAYVDNCEPIINCTNLDIKPETLPFESEEIELTGHVLGTADILAQMGDRYYLESLPLLYMEQKDAGIEEFDSSMDLMRGTATFYYEVIENRLAVQFKNRCLAMQTHFREWWGIDKNLYLDYIEKNIQYLKKIVPQSEKNPALLGHYLKRRHPQNR